MYLNHVPLQVHVSTETHKTQTSVPNLKPVTVLGSRTNSKHVASSADEDVEQKYYSKLSKSFITNLHHKPFHRVNVI